MYWQHLGTFLMRQWVRSCGSPPWPETGHRWAPGQSVESLGSIVCTDTSHPRGSQLESGLGTMRAMYCTNVYGLTMTLRISSLDLVQQSGFHWLAHGGVYASPDRYQTHHQTSHTGWCCSQFNVHNSSSIFITCAQYGPAFICEENGPPVMDLPVLVLSGEC